MATAAVSKWEGELGESTELVSSLLLMLSLDFTNPKKHNLKTGIVEIDPIYFYIKSNTPTGSAVEKHLRYSTESKSIFRKETGIPC